ncbi:cytochrome c biogenesis protein ResB [Mobilicoccus pelagius]|uniref:Cytochrome c biogenesis protein ResB n=1 Tax=Mobilicoccus pelagius NBRC 104925 TaxID=1089455 RepID=H5US21_9MICO|nr:cytochrome c biogenesis protein ResB [Mobilicoccus pelagius]GAB48529.1 cytochrome c biogenesis protein ResB [Mobilicoccus pelagius NBRC 104925]
MTPASTPEDPASTGPEPRTPAARHSAVGLDDTPDSPTTLDSLPDDPGVAGPLRGPRLGFRGWVRFLWRQLTSMRTALLLLLLVALAAIPGSVFPQRNIDVTAVDTFIGKHPVAGPILDTLGFFGVYTSPWFSAIYLLLVISLVGCILPRTATYRRTLTGPPPAVPRRPERLGTSLRLETSASPAEVEDAARALLRHRRYRLRRADDRPARAGGEVAEVAAETGYLREAGNLLFHYGVVAVILSLAAGYLVGWKGDRIVPIGESFANNRAAYHTFSGGPLVDADRMQPFVVTLDSMVARFEDEIGTGQLGAPREFRVETTVRDTPGGAPRTDTLAVNHPLEFSGAEVYLLGNGYAPVVTVRDAGGRVLYRQATPFLPDDGNYRSSGAIKVPAASPKQLGFSGVFLPTVVEVGEGSGSGVAGNLESGFPGLNDPMLVLAVHEGTLFPDSEPQSVYRLDTRGLDPVKDASGAPLTLRLRPGEKATLPGGRGSVELSAVDRWAGVSTRYDPVKGLALGSSVVMLLGLLASLVVPRRRVFLRARREGAPAVTTGAPPTPGTDPTATADPGTVAGPRTQVVLAGLTRRDDAGLPGTLRDLAEDLAERLGDTTIIDSTEGTDRS